METFYASKLVAALPPVLTPNTIYIIRTGVGFDFYCSDSSGVIAHKINSTSFDHIALTSTVGLVKTYTIWGDSDENINLGTFEVIDGIDGVDGSGIVATSVTDNLDGTHTVEFFTDLTKTQKVGEVVLTDGADGISIDHVDLTSTVGLVKTYTIWGDSAETINLGTFDVRDGTVGSNGLNAIVTTTSSSSNMVSIGSKTFTYSAITNLGWSAGQRLRVARTSTPTTVYMEGIITSVSSTSVTITVDNILGTGTYTDWSLSIGGDKGATGEPSSVITLTQAAYDALGTYDSNTIYVIEGGRLTIDHISLTSMVGSTKTYTVWGNAAETLNLGTFSVIDGVSPNVVVLTQYAYDTLGTYDTNTFYVING